MSFRLQDNKKKYIIFDFDGTLVDSEQSLLESIQVLNIPQLAELTQEHISELKQLGMKDALRKLGIPLYKVPSIVLQAQKEMSQRVEQVQLYDGIAELVVTLKKNGYVLAILTSNSVENVQVVLNRYTIVELFEFIHGEKNLFGKDKPLKTILKKYELNADDVMYIGDEVRDFEACQKVGVPMIGVSWGYNSAMTLRSHGLEKIAKTPTDILKLLIEIS